jgi:pimeloyl-ACP methyl ester carboxylesterase
MELLEGETLRDILGHGMVSIRWALTYAAQAAEGLASAHAKGIIHRDLKPENLFVTKEGRVKVLDFGLAKLTGAEPPPSDELPPGATAPGTLTTPGVLLGTVAYMAPEQIRGATVDGRADVFALGVVLYEMLTGRRPFPGSTSADVMSAILHQEPPPLTALRPDVPAQLAWLLRRCLAKDPDRRVQTMLDVRNELEDLVHAMDHGTLAESTPARKEGEPVERQLVLTAAHVRQLSMRSPRLIGFPMRYLDNQRDSDTLVVCLHGIGGDHRRFEPALRSLQYRGVALTLAGFAPGDDFRPVLPFDDHSQLLRLVLADLVRECRPARTILVGYSAGADQFLRMLVSPEGIGVDVAGFVGLGTNVSLETCFVSRLYATMEVGNADGILDALKWLGSGSQSLNSWLRLHNYVTQTFMKFGAEMEPLQRCSADLIAPFENGGDPFPEWYRAATQRIRSVRFVFSTRRRCRPRPCWRVISSRTSSATATARRPTSRRSSRTISSASRTSSFGTSKASWPSWQGRRSSPRPIRACERSMVDGRTTRTIARASRLHTRGRRSVERDARWAGGHSDRRESRRPACAGRDLYGASGAGSRRNCGLPRATITSTRTSGALRKDRFP